MREIKYIVVHCSFTPEGRDVKTSEIKRWHVEDNNWSDIGYHIMIELDGMVFTGRPVEVMGAGVLGHNHHSIHICYVGGMSTDGEPKDTRTKEQKKSLLFMLRFFKGLYPKAKIVGHRDLDNRDCPSFDALNEYKHI